MIRLKENINNNITQKNQAVTTLSREIKGLMKEHLKKDTNGKNQL